MLLFLRAFPVFKTKKSEDEVMPWYFDKASHKPWLKILNHGLGRCVTFFLTIITISESIKSRIPRKLL